MKTGKTLAELAAELTRQASAKRDFVTPTPHLRLLSTIEEDGAKPRSLLRINGSLNQNFPVGEIAHRQIANRLGIPAAYYDRLRKEIPTLLDENVNRLFDAKPEPRMVRTLDGNVRAFLSNRYRRIDHADLAQIVLPEIGQLGGQVASCEVTESKLYVKVTFPGKEKEFFVKRGTHERIREVVRAGFVWSNSEIGMGLNEIRAFAEILTCTNGMVIEEFSQRTRHVGPRVGGDDNGSEELSSIWSDETRKADDRALALKVRDSIRAVADEAKFSLAVKRMENVAQVPVKANPAEAVEVLAQETGITEGEKGDVLRHLIEGGDLSRWGFIQAITRTAQDVSSYDRATELEALGGDLLMVSGHAPVWEKIDAIA